MRTAKERQSPSAESVEGEERGRQMDRSEMLRALKRGAEQWLVVSLDGRSWFSDGAFIAACASLDGSSGLRAVQQNKWATAIARHTKSIPVGYVGAAQGELRGEFMQGYLRAIVSSTGHISAQLQEQYVRYPGECQILVHPDGGQGHPVYFARGCLVVAVCMPAATKRELPVIPFLEDAVLFHICPEGELP